jgi:CubicO group peptidase (beta-lactamase class C family)
MRKILKTSLIALGGIALALILVIAVSCVLYSPEYMWRVLSNGESKITDHTFFPARSIAASSAPYRYAYDLNEGLGNAQVHYISGGEPKEAALDALLKANGTTAFVVIFKDRIVYESYFNGHDNQSVETSFSSVKSLDSLMIGMAIEDGFIKGVEESIANYIPEFKGTDFEDITLENLLMMRSKIRYEEGFAWFTDDAKTYYMPDLRELALHHLKIDPGYQGQFHYNNYHPLLLGIILERATGMPVADYFQKKIWDAVGAEHDAYWSLDSDKASFEKMESGLNFRAVDYAKIGSMLLNGGVWNGKTVVNKAWIDRSTIAPEPLSTRELSDFGLTVPLGYQYMWYSAKDGIYDGDFFSAGKYGQYIYVSPAHDAVIVRTGANTGSVDWWPGVFGQIADAADA